MSIPVITFFNNKGGVGKTTLVYHLAWMFAELGLKTLSADLDPQANLTAAFLKEEELELIWPDGPHVDTIAGSLDPLRRGIGDIGLPTVQVITPRLFLLAGDLQLSNFEDELSVVWPKCSDGDERAFRVTSAFWRVMQNAAAKNDCDLILVDVGPNLGAINRSALISSDYVVVPLSPDLFSIQGLRNLGPRLREWRAGWKKRVNANPTSELGLPPGEINPIGYLVQQHSVRLDRPVQAYDRWIRLIPNVYSKAVLDETGTSAPVSSDPNCIALVKHYRSLIPMAQQAKKPMFALRPADGALGSHFQAAQLAYKDFSRIAQTIASRTAIKIPASMF